VKDRPWWRVLSGDAFINCRVCVVRWGMSGCCGWCPVCRRGSGWVRHWRLRTTFGKFSQELCGVGRWRRWEYNVKMTLTEIRRETVYCMHLAMDRDQWQAAVTTVMKL